MHPSPSPTPILIQMVGGGDAAPWWGVPVVAGVFLLLGGVLGFVFNRINEDRKVKRERSERYHADVLSTCTQLVVHVDTVADRGYVIAALLKRDPLVQARQSTQNAIEQKLEEMLEAASQVASTHATLRLVAPSDIREAAVAVNLQASKLYRLALEKSSDLLTETDQMMKVSIVFQGVVRKYLTGELEPKKKRPEGDAS